MDPVAALRRIAFLLERDHANTYKVQAFRTAAATVAAIPEAELRSRRDSGGLSDLPGIGATTATVVEQALAGRTPDYLADLESSTRPVRPAGEPILRQLRGDLHSHTDASDGGSPLAEMAATATQIGHEYLAVTDHSPRLTVANGLSPRRLVEQVNQIDAYNREHPDGVTLLAGIEVDINTDGSLDQVPELLQRLDVVVASLHSELRAPSASITSRLLAAIGDPQTDVLGHVTGRRLAGARGNRPPSQFDAGAVFAACAEHRVAVEINSRPERLDPPKHLLAQAVRAGCLFSIDSDAHAPGQLDWLDLGCERAAACQVPVERIVNTWPLARLLEWLNRSA